MLRRPFLHGAGNIGGGLCGPPSPKREPLDGNGSPVRGLIGNSDDMFNEGQYGSLSFKRDIENQNNQNHFYYNSPHDYKSAYYKQKIIMKFLSSAFYFLIGISIALFSLRVAILKNLDNSLVDFKVTKVDNVLATVQLLMFEIESNATNVNFQDVSIWDMDLDVFMVTDSSYLNDNNSDDQLPDDPDDMRPKKSDLTILLGNSTKFVTPFQFGGILDSASSLTIFSSIGDIWYKLNHKNELEPTVSTAQIKISHPGSNFNYKGEPLTDEQWNNIFNNAFRLVIRGKFTYNLPMMPNSEIINISSEADVDPSQVIHKGY
ncbi:unnamed protein product [Ambrosiozyma monospora]|uniref:Unnamed protein product n=1 Tax=Ambrosiozyma monospora TaxID=43982 RepID=A0ACB5T0I8_AMBMO|nr:unnamed protein product [Ambrosiozyma monospora]